MTASNNHRVILKTEKRGTATTYRHLILYMRREKIYRCELINQKPVVLTWKKGTYFKSVKRSKHYCIPSLYPHFRAKAAEPREGEFAVFTQSDQTAGKTPSGSVARTRES